VGGCEGCWRACMRVVQSKCRAWRRVRQRHAGGSTGPTHRPTPPHAPASSPSARATTLRRRRCSPSAGAACCVHAAADLACRQPRAGGWGWWSCCMMVPYVRARARSGRRRWVWLVCCVRSAATLGLVGVLWVCLLASCLLCMMEMPGGVLAHDCPTSLFFCVRVPTDAHHQFHRSSACSLGTPPPSLVAFRTQIKPAGSCTVPPARGWAQQHADSSDNRAPPPRTCTRIALHPSSSSSSSCGCSPHLCVLSS
jgi:hypothetical protein